MYIRKNAVLTLGIALAMFAFAGSATAQTGAWSAPSGAPPTGNVAAPINVGSATQTKAGRLLVGSFGNTGPTVLVGHVDIGVCPVTCSAFAGAEGPKYAENDPRNAVAMIGNAFSSLFAPKAANAQVGGIGAGGIGGPGEAGSSSGSSSYEAPALGQLDVWGLIKQNGVNVCLQDGTNCGSSGQWTTSGANIYRGSGKVGIGFSGTPASVLEIRDTNAQLTLGQSDANRWKLWGGSNLHFRKADDTDVLFLGSDGKVGIGTTSPSDKLTVNGDGKIGNVQLVNNQGGSLELGAGGGSTTPFIDFHGNGGTTSDFNARIINDGSGQLSFQNGGGTKLQVVNTSQSVIVDQAVKVYLDCAATGGKITLNAVTGSSCPGGGPKLVGYLLPPEPSSGGGSSGITFSGGVLRFNTIGHAVGDTTMSVMLGQVKSGGTPSSMGFHIKDHVTGASLSDVGGTINGVGYTSVGGPAAGNIVGTFTHSCAHSYDIQSYATTPSGTTTSAWTTYFAPAC